MSVTFEGREVKAGDRIKTEHPLFGESDWWVVRAGGNLLLVGPKGEGLDLRTVLITAHEPKPEPITVQVTLPVRQRSLARSNGWSDEIVLKTVYRWVAEAHKRGLL